MPSMLQRYNFFPPDHPQGGEEFHLICRNCGTLLISDFDSIIKVNIAHHNHCSTPESDMEFISKEEFDERRKQLGSGVKEEVIGDGI